MPKSELNDFEKQVCKDCHKSTKQNEWNHITANWFYRMDFIPAAWKYYYLTYLKEISQSTDDTDND